MSIEKSMPLLEILKENLQYDSLTGIFTWLISSAKCIKVGDIAGSLDKGYVKIQINKKIYFAHRLAWLYMTGEMPKDVIDHINGIRNDNRICNLREATGQQNSHNQIKPFKNNTTGRLGVTFDKTTNKFLAQIRLNTKTKYIGRFSTLEEASAAYIAAKRKYHSFYTI